MDKAYSLKGLVEKLKSKGLPILEESAEQAYEAVTEWIVESAKLSANPYDDLGIPFVSYVDGIVKPTIDKIDGQPG